MRGYRQAGGSSLPEKHAHVKFFFEELGAAIGVAEIFGGVTAGADLDADGAALEGSVDVGDPLSMRVVERFRDANDGGQAAGDALVVGIQG